MTLHFEENAFERSCKMLVISFWSQCVNSLRPSDAYMRQQTNHHWFRPWLAAWKEPSHYLNQCQNIVNLTLRNKLQWNFNRYSNIFIQENPFQNVIWKMAAILSQPQCVNTIIFKYVFFVFLYKYTLLWFVHWGDLNIWSDNGLVPSNILQWRHN